VSKNGLLLVSLVGAIPGAFVVYVMVMAFVNYAAGPAVWPKALAGMSLLCGLLLAVMPIGIFVYGGPKTEKAPAEKSGDKAESTSGDEETIIAESEDDPEYSSGATDESLEVVGASDEFAMTGEIVTGDADSSGSEEFDLGSDFEVSEPEEGAVEVLEDDEFDDDAPKKKK
jgi:hypothetical protein